MQYCIVDLLGTIQVILKTASERDLMLQELRTEGYEVFSKNI